MTKTEEKWRQQVDSKLEELERTVYEYQKQIDKIAIDISTVKEQNEKILAGQYKTHTKMEDIVHRSVQEATEPLSEQLDEFTDKKVIKVNDKQVEKLGILRKVRDKIRFWNRK